MSFWGKLGKIALKAAPIAAAFIPGVGPLASMAIGGLSSGASSKLEGGSWKDALLSGGIGAGTSYGLGKLGSMKGLGPSNPSSYVGKEVGNVAKAGGGSALGRIFGSTAGKVALGAGGGLGGLALGRSIANRGDDNNEENYDYTRGGAPTFGGDRFARQMRRQLGPVMGQTDQNFPNLAESIGQGRMDAMRDQPFRGGYDVRNTVDYDEEDNPIYEYTPMPRIGPNYRQPRQAQFYGGGGNPDYQESGFGRRRRRQEANG